MADDLIPLSQAIQALRHEIVESLSYADGEDVRFALGPIECEFVVAATRATDGKFGATFKIFGLGFDSRGDIKAETNTTQRIKMTITPVFVDENGKSDPNREVLIRRKKA